MKLLVATDIFGVTPELVAWLTPILHTSNFSLQLVSPYTEPLNDLAASPTAIKTAQPLAAADELAYQRFIEQGGLCAYDEKLQQSFAMQHQPFIAVGFSAGAAALWQQVAKPQPWLQQACCFYGGQIRHCRDLTPLVNTTLIWAQEFHFDVEPLHRQLQQRTLVTSVLTQYQHGFINPYSAGFSAEAAGIYQQYLIEKLG